MGILYSRPSANLSTEGSGDTAGQKPPPSTFQRMRKNAGLLKSRMFAPKDKLSRGIYHKYNNLTAEDLEPDKKKEEEEQRMIQIYEDEDNDENDINVEEASFCYEDENKREIKNEFLKNRCDKYIKYKECKETCENEYNKELIKYLKVKRKTKKKEKVEAIKQKIKGRWKQYEEEQKQKEQELLTLNKEKKSLEQLRADKDMLEAFKSPTEEQKLNLKITKEILDLQDAINSMQQPRLEQCNNHIIDLENLNISDPKTEEEKEEIEKLNDLLLRSCNSFKGGKRISRKKHKKQKQKSRKLFPKKQKIISKKIFKKSRKLFPKKYSKKLKKN